MIPSQALIADKACGADDVRNLLATHGIIAAVSHMPTRRRPMDIDAIANEARNITQRTFSHQKDWGAIATQHDEMHRTSSLPSAPP